MTLPRGLPPAGIGTTSSKLEGQTCEHQDSCLKRRSVVLACLVALAAPNRAGAQSPAQIARVGILYFGSPPAADSTPEPIVSQLRLLGFVEGRNIAFERRYAEGKREAYATLAAELLHAKPNVIYAPGSDIASAFQTGSLRIPVVFTVSDDPVASGLVQSLARPGGMFTGVTLMSPQLAAKRLELLREALPSLRRVAVLHDPEHRATYLDDMRMAAQRMALDFVPLAFKAPDDFGPAFARAKQAGAEAIFIEPTRYTLVYARQLGELAIEHRIAAISAYDLFARAGGLLSYGARYEEQGVRAAAQIQRILNGASPADLPVEQPTRFVLVLNLRTAKALGLTVPQTLLLRADELIQ